MISFWIVLISSVLAVYASPGCDEDVIKVCGGFKMTGNQYPKDAFELDEQCNEEEPKFACYTDFMRRCPTVVTQTVHDFFVASQYLIQRMCHGDLREKYLRNANCFGEVMTSKQNTCEVENKDKLTFGVCEYQALVEECIGSFVKGNCGIGAFEFLLELQKVIRLVNRDVQCA